MVGPPRGPARPPMAPQPPQTHHQLILKQVATPFTMLTKPPAPNYVNYLSLPVMPGNGGYLAVSSKPGETNGTTILTVAPRSTYTENNNSATYIAMDNLPHSHQYLIPKPEPFAMHNYSKNEPATGSHAQIAPAKRRSPAATRPTNHQRIKEEDEEEGEEVRPLLDPSIPFQEQIVKIDHNYPHWLPSPPPQDDDKESTISSDEKIDHNEEGEETETAAEGEDSVTRCICNLEHDDGYMISCDQCYVWQHVACVLPDTPLANSLPDMAYLCDICQPRDLDRHRARALQIQRRKQILHRDESSNDSWSSADCTAPPPKKTVARRRAEPIPRRPSKRDATDGPIRNKSDVRSKKFDSLLEISIRSKLLKVGSKGRRESSKIAPLPPQPLPPTPSVGRRTKLKRKFENKTNQRRKSKSKESTEIKVEKEEERKRPTELRARAAVDRQVGAKSRCRLSQSATGEPMVVTTCRVNGGEPLSELRGKYLQSTGITPKAEVLFHYRFPKDGTEVLMDGSGRENVARHARRCCTPNAQLKHCMVKGSLRLYLVALETLDRNQQVTIPHGSVTESAQVGVREMCGKDCKYNPSISNQKLSPRRRSRRCTMSEESDREVDRDGMRSLSPLSPTHSDRDRKLTREEKKIEQAMKIFAQMERDTARKRDKTPNSIMTGSYRRGGDSDKESPVDSGKPRRRRRRRKRRNSRKSRIPSGSGTGMSAIHSGDDSDGSSGDELPSPYDKNDSKDSGRDDDDDKIVGMDDAAGLLLALGGARHNPTMSGRQTPPMTRDHSENDSSPSTPLSSACLLVAAAVGPLAPGFKFPKTKKGMMNEWLGKSPEHVPADLSPSTELGPPVPHGDLSLPPGAPKLSNLSNRLFYPAREQCAGFAGFGKKRWLRQAISEVTEAPLGSPPCPPDNGTPLKKRRLARESLTSEPPATPPQLTHPEDDAVFGGGESPKSPGSSVGGQSELAERVRIMQREYEVAQGIDSADGGAASSIGGVSDVVDDPPSGPPEATFPTDEPSQSAAPPQVYDTSPQQVPENLTLPRPSPSPPVMPISPLLIDPRPARRGRKRPAARGDPRTSPRVKRWTRKSEIDAVMDPRIDSETNGQLESEGSVCDTDAAAVQVSGNVEPNAVKIEVKLESRLEGNTLPAPQLELYPVKQEEDSKSSESFFTEVKNEHSVTWFNQPIKGEYHGPSNMDLLAMEATRELKKPLPDVKPEVEEEDKAAPIRRKLSITEYLKRKKGSGSETKSESESAPDKSEGFDDKTGPSSPASDDDISQLMCATPSLPLPLDGVTKGRFKLEPTELERQRENLNERLRREFGLVITDEDSPRTTITTDPSLPPPIITPPPTVETNGFPESKLDYPAVQNLPQSAIYPVGSSNPPNPFAAPYPAPERRKFRK